MTPTGSRSTASSCASSTSSAASSTSRCSRPPPSSPASATASSSPSRSPRASSFNFGQVSVSSSIPGLNAAAFQPLLAPVADRGIYNIAEVDRVIQRMTYQAGQAGYAFVEIRPQITRNEAARTVDINFEILEGDRVFIERIDITGNTRTLDRVDPPPVPHRRGRRLQRPRDQRGAGPHPRPRLFRDRQRQRAAGLVPGPGAGRGRGRGAADRLAQPRRRLLVERGPLGADQPDRAQLPRPRPDPLGRGLGEHRVQQLPARLLRAGALRP